MATTCSFAARYGATWTPGCATTSKSSVYNGNDLSAILKIPLLCGAGVFLVLLPFAVTKDVKRQKALKYGRRLKGPERLTPQAVQPDRQGRWHRLQNRRYEGDDSDSARRPKHSTCRSSATPGAGKSALHFQVLRQVRSRGDSAIVYDPAREFVKRFYDPTRGDVILNPLDARCPYWGPAEELRSRSEAKALAASLFQPPQDQEGRVFHRVAAENLCLPDGLRADAG